MDVNLMLLQEELDQDLHLDLVLLLLASHP